MIKSREMRCVSLTDSSSEPALYLDFDSAQPKRVTSANFQRTNLFILNTRTTTKSWEIQNRAALVQYSSATRSKH
jgi:hypothetical protein